MESVSYHHGDLAVALTRAARGVVEASGWEAVSLRAVARAVGVSPNATYRHFEDKSALLRELAREAFAELAVRMRRAQGRKDSAVARFEATGRAYFGYALDHPELFRLMFSPIGRGAPNPADGPTPYEILGQSLDALVEAGDLARDARSGCELLAWTAVHGLSTLALSGAVTSRRDRTRALEDVIAFVVAGLRAR